MKPNICNHCGGALEYRGGLRVCSSCGAYKPRILSEEESVLLYEAFQKLRLYEFDEAERDFVTVIRKYPENPEGYWGRLLSKYGIKYKADDSGGKIPFCDISLDRSITAEEDYIKAESLASKEMAAYYRVQAEYIDRAYTERTEDTPSIVLTADVPDEENDAVFENAESIPDTKDPMETEKKKRNRKIFLIFGIALGILLAVLTAIFFLVRECSHEEATGAAFPPTCTQDGRTEWKYCVRCEEILVPYETVPAFGHTPDASAVCTEDQCCIVCGEVLRAKASHIPGEAATCLKGQECTVCHAELSPASEHTPGAPATCASGQYCLVCKEELAPESHVPGPPATCTDGQSCTLCGLTLDPGGHTAEPATCTMGSYCTVCYEELSEPLSHVPGPAPTCTTNQVCTLCGLELAPDNGHAPDVDASCTEDSVCLTCGDVLIKAYGHTLSEFAGCTESQYCLICYETLVFATEHTPGTEATCTQAQECLACNAELMPPLGHGVLDWTVDKEPDFGVAGNKRGNCSLCGETLTEEIPALYSEGLSYTLNADGTYSVSGAGSCTDTWIVLPSVHEDIPVTSIAENAFYNCATLWKMTIPDGITEIGNRAFYLCKNLREISVPQSVTRIGDFAFFGCAAIASVSVPEGVTSIGNYAFSGCNSLTEMTLPVGLTSIGISLFANCNSLTAVVIPNGVTAIGDRAFYYCGRLSEIVIPETVKTVGDSAFYFCNGLSKIVLSAKLTDIGDYAFYRCTDLKEIVIPETVTAIGDGAFSLCVGLRELVIPKSVVSIGDHALADCQRLGKISFAGSAEQWALVSRGAGCFDGIPAEKVICSDGEAVIG